MNVPDADLTYDPAAAGTVDVPATAAVDEADERDYGAVRPAVRVVCGVLAVASLATGVLTAIGHLWMQFFACLWCGVLFAYAAWTGRDPLADGRS